MKIISGFSSKFLRRISIQSRLFVTFLLISSVPVLFVGLYSFRIYTSSVNLKVSQAAEQTINMLNTTIEVELSRYSGFLGTLSVHPSIQAILYSPEDQIPNTDEIRNIATTVNYNSILSKYLKNVQLCNQRGEIVSSLGYDDIPAYAFRDLLAKISDNPPGDNLEYVQTLRGAKQVALGRKLFSIDGSKQPVGYILVYFDESLFSDELFSNVTFGTESTLFCMDDDGAVISSQNPDLLGTRIDPELLAQLKQAETNGRSNYQSTFLDRSCLMVYSKSRIYNTYSVAAIPTSYIISETRSIARQIIVIIPVLIAISLLFTFVIYRSITHPIRKMVDFCNNTVHGDLGTNLADVGSDELGVLAGTINHMLNEIRQLIHNREADQERKRQLELEMLQYQINPHFLFNTLNTFKWVASMNDVPVLTDGIGSLSALLRDTLMTKEEFVTIRHELESLQFYFSIQRLRYADSFTVAYELEEDLLACMIPRFILQPLAENSIIHGTGKGAAQTQITVICEAHGDDILLSIEDNGPGFDTERQLKNKSPRGHFTGIGTKNVAERLKLYYGDPYGLTIHSVEGEGTSCTILVPRNLPDKEQPDV